MDMPKTEIIAAEDCPIAPVPASETTAIISMIERVALNPDADIDKMERLLEMQERILDRKAKASYAAAFAEMQDKFPTIPENGHGQNNTSYALWEDINEAIKPVLAKHGFGLSFRPGRDERGLTITAILLHRDGHSEEATHILPMDTSGNKNAVQAVGSSSSYGMRYTTQELLNLASRGDDDDGDKGCAKWIDQKQVDQIRALIDTTGADIAAFCKFMKAESLPEIRSKDFGKAIQALNARQQKKHSNGNH